MSEAAEGSHSTVHPAVPDTTPLEGIPSPSSSSAPRARSTSRGRNSNDGAMSGQQHPSSAGSGSHPRSAGPTNIPLPSPSAVHINQSLEDSLRRNEEERIRRSAERRERRRRRIEQSKQSSARKAQSGSASTVDGKPPVNEREQAILEDAREAGDASLDSLDDESALVTSPTLAQEEAQAQAAESQSSDSQGAYYYEGYGDEDYDSEFEEFDGRSLTRQLAETAVSVREMSRELGRARVKSNVQSVLIVTKARDNQLIKLTREIAMYLMKTPRYGRSRGLIVYVDSQLKKSKRFDAAGIERDNPLLFRNESRHHHHHHHHSHHSHHYHHNNPNQPASQGTGTPAGSGTPRRSESRRTSNNSAAASSINLFGMTRSDVGNSSASLSALDRNFLSNPSTQSSGATTPAPGYPKPMTKLTEALVTRQIDRQLEKENARRQSQSASSTGQGQNGSADGSRISGHKVAFSTSAAQSENGANASGNNSGEEQTGLLRYWTAEMCSKSPQLFDLVLTLGGDGTVLFTSWLFQHVVPPVIPFALGSLGFLTNFDFSNYKEVLEMAINEGVRVNLRMRFTATIYRAVPEEEQDEMQDKRTRVVRSAETGQLLLETSEPGQWTKLESSSCNARSTARKDREVRCSITRPVESFEVLNDLVVDRGPSPYVSLLELFGDEHHLTTVQADGLCVATPTGSTAYSLSAGGSLVHPEIPTLLITPICPHTLSFRPMLLPDSMELRIAVPYNSRSTAWASFDGRGRVELRQGDHIKVTASTYPFPTVCADKQSTDWFQAITRTLKWNERQRQKSFVMLEHDRQEPHDSAQSKAKAENGYKVDIPPVGKKASATQVEVPAGSSVTATPTASSISSKTNDEEEEDDDGHFDIDDLSSTSAPSTDVGGKEDQKDKPLMYNPSGEPYTFPERHPGAPIVRPPLQPGFRQADGPKSPSEHDVSHSSAQHLRQYATNRREGSTSSRSARERTPRGSDIGRISTIQNTAADSTRPRSRNSFRRSHRVHAKSNADRVKAFVVFGADSSDFDTSTSGDESDETAVRQARQP